jgi:hypothetical protein
MPKGNVLTPEQRQAIVDHRLNGVPVAAVIQMTGHARQTVINVFRDYMSEHADEHRAEIEQVRVMLVARHERAAFTARVEGERAKQDGDTPAHARYLREERESLREIARLTGAESAVKLDVSGEITVNVQQEREALKARLVAMCHSPN